MAPVDQAVQMAEMAKHTSSNQDDMIGTSQQISQLKKSLTARTLIVALVASSLTFISSQTLSTSVAVETSTSTGTTGSTPTTPRPAASQPTTIEPIIQDPSKPPRRIWSGWIPYYSMRTSLPAALNNNDLIREVMLFWYTLKGPTRILDLYKGANPNVPMDTPLAQLRSAGYLLIPTLTDGTNTLELQGILSKPKQRAQTINTILELVRSKNFDGIDLNFEGFAFKDGTASWNKTRPLWVDFVKELSTALRAEGKLLSVTTPVLFDPASGKRGYWVYDWAGIAEHIDRLRVMTYDYATSRPGPIGPLFWAEDAMKYAVSVMPASKIFMGVAGYGRDWVTKVTGTCPKDVVDIVKAGARASTFVMRDAPNLVARYGANAQYRNREGEVNFTYERTYTGVTAKGNPTTCTASRTAWYQDSRGYMARAQLVEKYRLGGLVAWTIGMEEANAMLAIRGVAREIAPDVVRADLTLDRNSIRFGEVVQINARFMLPDKVPAANIPTTIQMRSGTTGWRDIYQGATDNEGRIVVNSVLGNGVQFRAISEGSWERLAATSTEVAVKVDPALLLKGPTLSTAGASETFTATLTPLREKATIVLERLDRKSSSYVEVSRGKVDAKGSVNLAAKISEGFHSYRARLVVKGEKPTSPTALVSSSLWVTALP